MTIKYNNDLLWGKRTSESFSFSLLLGDRLRTVTPTERELVFLLDNSFQKIISCRNIQIYINTLYQVLCEVLKICKQPTNLQVRGNEQTKFKKTINPMGTHTTDAE